MSLPLASDSWDQDELDAIQSVIDSGRYTMGEKVKTFENEFKDFVGSKNAVMVNSGSSANLLMASVLRYRFNLAGKDIIVPYIGWSTTYFPFSQNNMYLKFVDIDRHTLNIDVAAVNSAINENTGAICAVNLLGNPCHLKELKHIADENGIFFIEDNCESFGAKAYGKQAGTFGLMGSYSFFFSHHLQTMEGGMIVTDDDEIAHWLRSMRAHGWARDLPDKHNLYNKTGDWFKDHFTFVLPGYSVRPLEMEGAIGSVQLKKWPEMLQIRRQNAKIFQSQFGNQPWCDIQEEIGESSWYCFSLVFKGVLEGKRDHIAQTLINKDIEVRPIMTGNFTKNPVATEHLMPHNAWHKSTNADYVDANGLFFGNHVSGIAFDITQIRKIIKYEISSNGW